MSLTREKSETLIVINPSSVLHRLITLFASTVNEIIVSV